MKKHFLILMLLSLLPLVGWAQTAKFGDVSVGKYIYGQDALPTPVVENESGTILTKGTHYTVSTVAYKEEACTNEIAKKDMKGDQKYYLKITGVDAFEGEEKAVYFTVQKRPVQITVTATFSRDYLGTTEPTITSWDAEAVAGNPNSGLVAAFSHTKTVLGSTLEYTYAGKGNKDYPGGEYDITFSGLSSDQYEIIYPTKKFTINGTDISGETVTVKAGTAFADKTYKGAAYTAADLTGLVLVYGTKELVQGTDFDIIVGSGDWTNVGAPKYSVKFKGNYSGTKADFGSFNIVQAPISVDVENIEVTYKAAAYTNNFGTAPVKFNYYGLVGADVANKADIETEFNKPANKPKVAVAAAAGATDANTEEGYALKITDGGTGTYTNYKFVNYLNTGKLIIKPYEVELKAKPASKGPNAADPEFELADYTLADAGHTLSGVKFDREKGETVGESYDITPVYTDAKVKKGETDVTKNYTFKIVEPKGQLTINKAALTVTIKDQSKFYGDADPATIAAPVEGTNYIVSGLVAGDEITSVTLKKSWTDASDADNYILTADVVYTGAAHYETFTVVPGNFQIKKAPLTVTMPIKSVPAGATIAATAVPSKDGIVIEGLKKGETPADIYDLTLKATLNVDGDDKLTDQTDAAGYILTLKDAYYKNYEIAQGTDPETYAKTIAGKLIVGTGAVTEVALTNYASIVALDQETRPVKIDFNTRTRAINATAAKHTWTAGNWNALVLPFDIDVAELSKLLGSAGVGEYNYVVVNTVKPNSEAGKFQFQLAMGTIPANTPIMVKTVNDVTANPATAAITGVIAFGSKTIEAPESATVEANAGNGFKLVGKYENFVLDKTSTARDAEGNALYKFMYGDDDSQYRFFGKNSTNSWTIVPFDCYVDLSGDPAGARNVTFEFEEPNGTVTAITSVTVDLSNASKNAEGWYNLNGLKLQTAPTQKGVYIKDGKKFIVK